MSRVTACPECQTRFRVTETQLQMRSGKVRCGRCSHIFNALEYLVEEAEFPAVETASHSVPHNVPSPSAAIPVAAPAAQEAEPSRQDSMAEALAEQTFEHEPPQSEAVAHLDEPLFDLEITTPDSPAENDDLLFDLEIPAPETPFDAEARELKVRAAQAIPAAAEQASPTPQTDEAASVVAHATSDARMLAEAENRSETRVVRIQPPPVAIQPKVSPDRPKYAPPPKPRRAWPWALANLLLLIGLCSQGIYLFRSAIAAHYPPTRPLLEEACVMLTCKVDLPRNSDLISIESSELHADPARANIVVLTSILRNRAPHVQAYPMLELTLTNTEDEMVARMLLPPKDYLKASTAISQGIAANGEVAVKLLMDLGGIKAEGYRLYLFYPS